MVLLAERNLQRTCNWHGGLCSQRHFAATFQRPQDLTTNKDVRRLSVTKTLWLVYPYLTGEGMECVRFIFIQGTFCRNTSQVSE